MQPTENASFVVFAWVQIREDHIIGVREDSMAGRATWSVAFELTSKLAAVGAINAEDMAVCGG
jgi:hypothetical protein